MIEPQPRRIPTQSTLLPHQEGQQHNESISSDVVDDSRYEDCDNDESDDEDFSLLVSAYKQSDSTSHQQQQQPTLTTATATSKADNRCVWIVVLAVSALRRRLSRRKIPLKEAKTNTTFSASNAMIAAADEVIDTTPISTTNVFATNTISALVSAISADVTDPLLPLATTSPDLPVNNKSLSTPQPIKSQDDKRTHAHVTSTHPHQQENATPTLDSKFSYHNVASSLDTKNTISSYHQYYSSEPNPVTSAAVPVPAITPNQKLVSIQIRDLQALVSKIPEHQITDIIKRFPGSGSLLSPMSAVPRTPYSPMGPTLLSEFHQNPPSTSTSLWKTSPPPVTSGATAAETINSSNPNISAKNSPPPKSSSPISTASSTTPSSTTKKSKRQWKCNLCNYSSARAYNYNEHVKTHSEDRVKEHLCKKCGKTFSRIYDLQRHMNIHATEKMYTCMKCGRGFNRGDALKRHVESLHDDVSAVALMVQQQQQIQTTKKQTRTRSLDVRMEVGTRSMDIKTEVDSPSVMESVSASTTKTVDIPEPHPEAVQHDKLPQAVKESSEQAPQQPGPPQLVPLSHQLSLSIVQPASPPIAAQSPYPQQQQHSQFLHGFVAGPPPPPHMIQNIVPQGYQPPQVPIGWTQQRIYLPGPPAASTPTEGHPTLTGKPEQDSPKKSSETTDRASKRGRYEGVASSESFDFEPHKNVRRLKTKQAEVPSPIRPAPSGSFGSYSSTAPSSMYSPVTVNGGGYWMDPQQQHSQAPHHHHHILPTPPSSLQVIPVGAPQPPPGYVIMFDSNGAPLSATTPSYQPTSPYMYPPGAQSHYAQVPPYTWQQPLQQHEQQQPPHHHDNRIASISRGSVIGEAKLGPVRTASTDMLDLLATVAAQNPTEGANTNSSSTLSSSSQVDDQSIIKAEVVEEPGEMQDDSGNDENDGKEAGDDVDDDDDDKITPTATVASSSIVTMVPPTCPIESCGQSFDRRNKLASHLTKAHVRITDASDSPDLPTHGSTQIFHCPWPTCERLYNRKNNLAAHVNTFHVNPQTYTCTKPECGMTFRSKGDQAKHLIASHATYKVPAMCNWCGEEFAKNRLLLAHRPRCQRNRAAGAVAGVVVGGGVAKMQVD